MTIENLQSELSTILSRVQRPEHVVVTAGMPYANEALHIGHLAGAHVPADIFARFQRLLIGEKMFFLSVEQMTMVPLQKSLRPKKKNLLSNLSQVFIHSNQRP